MLNVYYVPGDFDGIPTDAIEVATIAELKAFIPPDRDAALSISTAVTHDAADILECFQEYRAHIATLAKSPHVYDRWVRMRPGPVAAQPFSSLIRILAQSIWVYQAGHWVELKTCVNNPGPGVTRVTA